MRTVVIGTSGQLALEVRRLAAAHGLELAPALQLDVSRAAEVEALLGRERAELVINASAYTAVDRAESDAGRAFAVNRDGPAHLAGWCRRHGAALLHVSTDYVFDGSKPSPYVENDPTAPLGVYGTSKLAGERAVRESLEQSVIVRSSWVFSAHGQNFVKTMLRLARERDELRVVADQTGRPTSAADLARALLLLAKRWRDERELAWGTYHFAGEGATTWYEFACTIVDAQAPLTGRRPRVTPIRTEDYPTPARRPRNSVLDCSRFARAFGITPSPWQSELELVIEALLGAPTRA